MRLFHTTDAAEAILEGGFRDGHGTFGIIGFDLAGVFLSNFPADVSDGAKGDDVLIVEIPDDVDLTRYAIEEEGHPICEWCVPADLLNERASVRLLTEAEVDALTEQRWERPSRDITRSGPSA